ncbi:MAG TPA: sugar ABC transporter ATP-binding protein [Devosia sp.]|jgi:ABC-type sugar transport system ATPase subunit|uniref:sugar ABC transporter ATP-binding protein n=1 Tax=Devosia sp. TaxID=1871048 RepID=UPI002DDD1C79|nr:sugar ABC transporter ATP-binding protein [Devosia sp.]HEV2514340.1 sugar ABC transporter ATP-binding protein [Devosia sp.]
MSIAPALEAINIAKRYGGIQALDGVSLRVLPGQIIALLGENGAGKSTLMKIATGLERPDSGELKVDGESVHLANVVDAHRRGISLVPQELTLCDDMSVAENIELGNMVSRRGVLDRLATEKSAGKKLAFLGAELDGSTPVHDLTLAERAFVQIARALASGTRVIVLDEPTAALSGDEAAQVVSAVKSLASNGVGVIYISHRLEEVYHLADEIVVMRDGRVARSFQGPDFDKRAVVSAMVGALSSGDSERSLVDGPVVLRATRLAGRNLADFSVEVRAGEIVAVYGVLGSGREEVAGCIVGASEFSNGSVTVEGQPVRLSGGMRAAKAAGMGYVPAERRSQGLVLDQNVEFNTTLAMLPQLTTLLAFNRSKATTLTTSLCSELSIKGTPTSVIGTLSGGNQQKVLVARWLAAGVRVLIMDEPTRGVDVGAKAEMYKTIRDQAAKGTAILICSSDLEEICAISDRVIVMRDGRVAAEILHPQEIEVAVAAASHRPTLSEPS